MKTFVMNQKKNRVLIVLLAALMAVGLSFAGANIASAAGGDPDVAPTEGERVWNPENDYTCPQGGMFRFDSEKFTPNATVVAQFDENGVALGSYEVDGGGRMEPAISGEPYPAFIVPKGTAPGTYHLEFYYDGTASPVYGFILTVSATPYTAVFEIVGDPSTASRYLHVVNTTLGVWAPGNRISVKMDYKDATVYGTFITGNDGTFDEYVPLPSSLIGTGIHTFTLLSDAVPGYNKVSLSDNLTL
jgi:hypothetical protein